MFFKRTPIKYGAIASAAFLLSGCVESSKNDPELDNLITSNIHNQENKDKSITNDLTEKLKKTDPTIIGSDFVLDENGNKTIQVHRQSKDGTIESWEMPASQYNESEASVLESNSSGGMSSIITGALLGYIASSMFSNSGKTSSYPNMHSFSETREKRRSVYSGASAAAIANQTTARARASGVRASSIGRTTSGAFSSSGARGGASTSSGS